MPVNLTKDTKYTLFGRHTLPKFIYKETDDPSILIPSKFIDLVIKKLLTKKPQGKIVLLVNFSNI